MLGNVVGGRPVLYANASIDTLRQLVVEAVKDGQVRPRLSASSRRLPNGHSQDYVCYLGSLFVEF